MLIYFSRNSRARQKTSMIPRRLFAGLFATLGYLATAVSAGLPNFDKIVVVIEENHALQQVLGSGAAPNLDSLAAAGAKFTGMFALTHPSQPNYLQFFSGSNQNIIDNNYAAGTPFATLNLGAAIIHAGETFVGYSETMPSVGFTGHDAAGGLYARRHNPWVNWQSNSPGPNQLPPSVNQPYSAFPSNYNLLPRVSIVVPNNANNMHDGTITQGDTWIKNNILAYATWAKANNSLLIITFDEDNSASRNRIPTLFYGANVSAGTLVSTTWTAHNLLRTIGDLVGAAPSGSAADARPIVGAFTSDPQTATISFRQGLNGYNGAKDTMLESAQPMLAHGNDTSLLADGSPQTQSLIRFDNLFGNAPGLVPLGSKILSAKLQFLTSSPTANVASTMAAHTMLASWSETDTWSSLANGVSTDGVEAAVTSEFTLFPNVSSTYAIFDVTRSIQDWANGAVNLGWLIKPAGADTWRFLSSNSASLSDRPTLEITYLVPEPTVLGLWLSGCVLYLAVRRERS